MGYGVFLAFMYFKHSVNSVAGADHRVGDSESEAVTGAEWGKAFPPRRTWTPRGSRHRGGGRLACRLSGGAAGRIRWTVPRPPEPAPTGTESAGEKGFVPS